MLNRLMNLDSDLKAAAARTAKEMLDWIAGGLSMAAALGFVNIVVGLLSASWLATQLYRFWRFEVRSLRQREERGELEG